MEELPTFKKENVYHNIGYILDTPCGKLRLQVAFKDKKEEEVEVILAHFGKQGTCALCNITVITALTTGLFKYCTPDARANTLVEAFGHRCGAGIYSCNDLLLRKIYDIHNTLEERKRSKEDGEQEQSEE